MHIPRFFLTELALDFEPGQIISIDEPGLVNQIRNVLRMDVQASLVVLDGKGQLYNCTIAEIQKRHVTCRIESVEIIATPPIKVQMALSLIKGDRFEWALQKLTELGVHSVVPIITSRTVVKIDQQDAKGTQAKLSRWQAILKEAAEQSERVTIPHLALPRKLNDFINDATAGGTQSQTFICAERLQVASLKDIFLDYTSEKKDLRATKDTTITLIVGPEGGFSTEEMRNAQERGAVPVSLGPRILRAETAAIISLAQVIWCLEK